MTTSWRDFNDAKAVVTLIPKGTVAKVRLTIRPGGYDDPDQGWTGSYATRGSTGSIYLNCEYTILEGPYARRKVFGLIGLFSPKGPDWGNMGRAFVRGLLNSAHGLSDRDISPQAQVARRIASFADLDGLEFVARIDVGTDASGDERNEIRTAVTPDHRGYADIMGTAPLTSLPEARAPGPVSDVRPSWAR
jgi:hypothetical protein